MDPVVAVGHGSNIEPTPANQAVQIRSGLVSAWSPALAHPKIQGVDSSGLKIVFPPAWHKGREVDPAPG